MSSSKKKQLRKEQYMTERQAAAAQEAKKLKRYTLTFWVVIALVVCIFVGAVVSNPITNAIYKNTKAMTVGDYTLSSVDVNYFYIDAINNFYSDNSYYISYILDVTAPLNEQTIGTDTSTTWADYFLESAKETIQSAYALYGQAVKNGYELTDTEKQSIDSQIATYELYAMYYGYDNLDSYLRAMFGAGSSEESYRKYLEVCTLATSYLTAYSESLDYSLEELQAYQSSNPYKYNSYTFATYELTVSDFLTGGTTVTDEDGKETTTYSDEEKAAAIEAAKAAADLLANGEYADVEAFDDAIKMLPINKDDLTAASTKHEDVLYDELTTLFQDWLIGKVESEDEDAEPTYEVRKAGDMTVIPYTTGSGESETVTKYYVVRYGSFNANDFALKNVRHILIAFEGGTYDSTTGVTTYSDEEKAAAKEAAEKLLAEWEAAGDLSEESFAALAQENSDDNADEGGLYEDIYPGEMVTNFEDWCYDAERKAGDYGIVESPYGYHIMFFVGDSDTTFRNYMIRNVKMNEDVENWHTALVEATTLEVLTIKHVEMDLVFSH